MTLWVCFAEPSTAVPADVLVLSFLPPGAEQRWAELLGERLVRGREALQDVRPRARRAYLDLIARLGAAPCVRGRSLRQELRGPDGTSRWWFLKVSEKDCVWNGDPTYSMLLRLFTVRAVADKHGAGRVVVHGGPRGFAEALGAAGASRTRDAIASLAAMGRGVAARLRFTAKGLYRWAVCRSLPWPTPDPCDVALEAHWDWSLGPDGAGGLRERYFADVPARLQARGARVAWLAVSEPDAEVWQRGRSFRRVASAACRHREVVFLDRFLTLREVLGTSLDLRYAIVVSAFMRSRAFRALFVVDDVDLYPVMRDLVLRLAWGTSVCRWEQVAIGTRRACRAVRPRLLLSFLEMFLHSKALYTGARLGAPGIAIWAAQHAAYSSDKTFGVVDPRVERAGEPDGCAVPAPDGIFVMGELSRRLWRDNGFDDDHVILTGGLRYQETRVEDRRAPRAGAGVAVLLVVGMNTEADIDMCDALTAAARELPDVRLRLRDHPQYCLSETRAFDRFRTVIDVTHGSADDALATTDLVCFTHSGFAEEALLRGIPTWQWLWPGFNTSVFVDLPVIPAFSSVAALRAALQSFVADPTAHHPARETREYVARQCFGPAPSRAAERVVEQVTALLAGSPR